MVGVLANKLGIEAKTTGSCQVSANFRQLIRLGDNLFGWCRHRLVGVHFPQGDRSEEESYCQPAALGDSRLRYATGLAPTLPFACERYHVPPVWYRPNTSASAFTISPTVARARAASMSAGIRLASSAA